jgi:quinol monooxygenase YgiN
MITEIARLTIDPAAAASFEAAVSDYANRFSDAPGCNTMTLERVVEESGCYYMRIQWDSVGAHEAMRQTEAAQFWRETVAPFYVAPPHVLHTSAIALQH